MARGLAATSAAYYAVYLRRLNVIVAGLDRLVDGQQDPARVIEAVERLPTGVFKSAKDRSNMLSVLRMYLDFVDRPQTGFPAPAEGQIVQTGFIPPLVAPSAAVPDASRHEIDDLFHDVRSLALRYWRTTGKPLGVTGELAELAASRLLNVELAPPRTAGFDGWMERGGQRLRVQVKGRSVPWSTRYAGRCPSIKYGGMFDIVLLVLIDQSTMQPREIWEATEAKVAARLSLPGSKARNERGAMGISQFKTIAELVWAADNA